MSAADLLATAKGATTLVENLKPTLATPAMGLTPSTFLAMVGIKNGTALTLAAPVQNTMSSLANIAASNSSANVSAAAAISSLSSFHASMGFGGTPNHAAFGTFLNQMHNHVKDAKELRLSTDFMANAKYADLGAGIKDMGSSVDRGMSNTLGDLPSVGALMAASGKTFNGGDMKDFGTALGMVKSLTDNKLATITGVNRRLAAAGVPLNDLDNPIYKDKIEQVMASITDPATLSVVADQNDVAPEIAATESTGNSTTDAILAKLQDIITRANAVADDIRSHWLSDVNDVSTWDQYNELKANWPISTTNIEYGAVFKEANEISLKEIRPLPDDEFKLQLVNFRNNDVEVALNDANSAILEFKGKIAGVKAMLVADAGPNPDGSSATTAAAASNSTITTGYSVPSTAMGADLSPGQSLPTAGGIGSLKDLSDPTKLASPSVIAGLTNGASNGLPSGLPSIPGMPSPPDISGLTGSIGGINASSFPISGLNTHLADLGVGTVKDAGAAGSFFSRIQTVQTPLTAAALPELGTMIKNNQGLIDSMTGTGSGPLGLPNMTDFTQHLAGGPSITSFLKNVGTDAAGAISALTSSLAGAVSLIATAGIDTSTLPANNLGTAMGFAKNLHKFGADTSGSGVGDILHNLANPATPEGEAIKASIAEGKNAKLLADNAIPPMSTTPPPPAPDETIVSYPITISRDFPRPPGSVTGSFITIQVIATSPADTTWRMINGETTTNLGYGPYAVMYTGNYDTLYAASKARLKEADPGIAPQAVVALPQMKAELESQTSGKTPKALG